MEIVGWLGSILFAACGLPQAIECYRTGHARGLAWPFLIMWFLGEVFTLAYIIPNPNWPLIFNYTINLVFLVVILRYKFRPR
jgi:uncharacterized protein with PQ loop repeat